VCIFSYWIYAGFDLNVQMAFAPWISPVLPPAALHAAWNALSLAPSSLAVHVPSVGVAGWSAILAGSHVDFGGGGDDTPSLLVFSLEA